MGMPDGIDLRCCAIVFRRRAVLLIHRTRDGADSWVLPGGTPRAGESMAACARREVREETGLLVDPARVAFVLEVIGPDEGPRTVDMVFAATESAPDVAPEVREAGMMPVFVPVEQVHELDLRPPVAGHLRSPARQRRAALRPVPGRPVAAGQRPCPGSGRCRQARSVKEMPEMIHMAAFTRQARVSADLCQFGACARLLADSWAAKQQPPGERPLRRRRPPRRATVQRETRPQLPPPSAGPKRTRPPGPGRGCGSTAASRR